MSTARARWPAVLMSALLALVLLTSARPAHADAAPSASAAPSGPGIGKSIGLGLGGALTAFLAHEAGHIFANLLLGNSPRFDGMLVWGVIPFFAVAPGLRCDGDVCTDRSGERFRAGRRGNYFIVTAGFHVQHLLDELILTRRPRIRDERAPFQKGMLLFNVALSCMYAVGAYTGLEDPHGDLAGAARASGMHHAWLATALLVPAALDTYRYWSRETRWSPWASRAMKATFLGLNFTF